jgi:uncharacterized repeat protein (TIGR02543 family)
VLDNTGDLEKNGHTFAGWNTRADGSGTGYAANAIFTITDDTTLYAQWTAATAYTVTYNSNGSTGGTVPSDTNSPYESSATVTVLDNTGDLEKNGHTFAGWNTRADGSGTGYAANATFTITGNTTLYAQWTAATACMVNYDGNGSTGGAAPSDTNSPYESGATVTVLGNTGNLEKTGHAFAGWNTRADGSGTGYAASATFTITGDTTLYAKWTVVNLSDLSSLAESLLWIDNNAEEGGEYNITVSADEAIAPKMLSYSGKRVSITIDGGAAERMVSLGSSGSLFMVGSGVTLTLGNNLTLRGQGNNSGSLVGVQNNGTLVMQTGSKISGNTDSSGDGGGVFVNNGGTFIMEGGSIEGNTASDSGGGGVYVSMGGTFTMKSGSIENNTSSRGGGGVYIYSDGIFTLEGGSIKGNTASGNSSGGGVYAYRDGTFTMKGGSIEYNTVSNGSGGGVYVFSGGIFTMEGGFLENNTASGAGGGVCIASVAGAVTGGTFTMEGGSIRGNTSSVVGGGGVYVNRDGTFTMKDGSIEDNTASARSYEYSGSGGGVYVNDGGTFTMEGGSIKDNTAAAYHLYGLGGGVYVNDGGSFTMRNGSIEGHNGEGVYVANGGIFIMRNGSIEGNNGDGGVRANGIFTMEGGSIKGNTAFTSGGGVSIDGIFTMEGGSIEGNTGFRGGGVHIYSDGTFIMKNGSIKDNTASDSDRGGGGVYINDGGTFTMENGSIEDNTASDCGGGVYVHGEYAYWIGTYIYGTFTMKGGSIEGNTASDSGGGVFLNNHAAFSKTGGTISGSDATGLPANTVTGYTNQGAAVFVGDGATLLKALEKTVGPGHNPTKEWNDTNAADLTAAKGWHEE